MSCGGFVGAIAISKHGHDKGEHYIIARVQDDKFVFVVNGENRPLGNPKRKNIRHLFVTKERAAATSDLEIKKTLKQFKKEAQV